MREFRDDGEVFRSKGVLRSSTSLVTVQIGAHNLLKFMTNISRVFQIIYLHKYLVLIYKESVPLDNCP